VGLRSTFGHLLDGVLRNLVEVVESLLVSISKALSDHHRDAANVSLCKHVHVLNEVIDGDTTREDGACGVLNDSVGKADAEHPVAHGHGGERVVNEEVARHHLVDEHLFYEAEGGVVLEGVFVLGLGGRLFVHHL